MKVGIVAFLFGLAFIHLPVADSIKANSEKTDDDIPFQEEFEKLPDGLIFRDDNSVFNVNITRDNEILLGNITIFMKNCTAKQCHTDTFFKFGERVLFIGFSLIDKDKFYNITDSDDDLKPILIEEDFNLEHDDNGGHDEDVHDAQENVEDIKN